MEVTQAEFARMAGVSRVAIHKKIENKTLIINSGKMLDTDNPVNRAYLDKKQNKQKFANMTLSAAEMTTSVSSPRPVQTVMMPAPMPVADTNIPAELLGLTLRELFQRFGSFQGLQDYVKILKDLTTADEKTQRLEERRQLQIPKDFVVARLFGFLNQLSNKILDVPDSMADQVIALVKSESDRAKIVTYMRDVLSRCIGGAKENIINELNSLKGKYDDDQSDLRDAIDELKDRG